MNGRVEYVEVGRVVPPGGYYPCMSRDHLSELNDGHQIVYAYCAGRDGGPPCVHSANLDLGQMIEQWGDISTDELRRRLRCRCGAGGDDYGLMGQVMNSGHRRRGHRAIARQSARPSPRTRP
jgi:hypothetical protein